MYILSSVKAFVTLFHPVVKRMIQDNKYNLDVTLALAVIKQESGGNPFALAETPDVGLMQITEPALTDYNVANQKTYTLFDLYINPFQNLKVGLWYLNWLFEQFDNDEKLAISAYNQGIGNVKRGTFTFAYYEKVKKHQTLIKEALS